MAERNDYIRLFHSRLSKNSVVCGFIPYNVKIHISLVSLWLFSHFNSRELMWEFEDYFLRIRSNASSYSMFFALLQRRFSLAIIAQITTTSSSTPEISILCLIDLEVKNCATYELTLSYSPIFQVPYFLTRVVRSTINAFKSPAIFRIFLQLIFSRISPNIAIFWVFVTQCCRWWLAFSCSFHFHFMYFFSKA